MMTVGDKAEVLAVFLKRCFRMDDAAKHVKSLVHNVVEDAGAHPLAVPVHLPMHHVQTFQPWSSFERQRHVRNVATSYYFSGRLKLHLVTQNYCDS